MTRHVRFLVFIPVMLALIVGLSCTQPQPPETQPFMIVQNGPGNTVEVKGMAQRIISVAPSNTEILYALGLEDRLLAVTDYDNYPPEVKSKPSVGGYVTLNIEKIVSMAPDLVLATEYQRKDFVPALERHGIATLILDPQSLAELMQGIKLVGRITGKETEADKVVASLETRIKAVTDKTAGLAAESKPSVFYVIWHDPLMSPGGGTLHDDLIQKAGGVNIFQNLEGYPQVVLESVVAANPHVIIAGISHGIYEDPTYQFAISESRLDNTDARINNRVYGIESDLCSRPGPRLIDGLERIAECIHPELFGQK